MALKKNPSPGIASSQSSRHKPEMPTDFPNMLTTALRPLLDQMRNLNNKSDDLQEQLKETTIQTEETHKTVVQAEAKTKLINQRREMTEKEQISDKEQLLQRQMEKSYVLRIQGIPGKKGEKLKEILSEALAPVTDLKTELIQSDMDMVYQTYPDFINKNKLPGEVFVKFSKRSMRDTILKATNGITLKMQDEEIRILKVIPFEIRKWRRQYKNLTAFLRKQSIPYRWIFPEGLIFNYKDKKEKIDSVQKAKAFVEKHQTTAKEKEKTEDTKQTEEESEHESGDSGSTTDKSSEDSNDDKVVAAPKLLKVRLTYDKSKYKKNKKYAK